MEEETAIIKSRPNGFWGVWLPAAMVAVMTLIMGAGLLSAFFADSRGLWNGIVHDRNGHAATAVQLARAVEGGQMVEAGGTILRCKVWPPLHGILAAATWSASGHDWRALILPSLAGWMLLVVGSGLLAARFVRDDRLVWLAAFVASALAAQSPAHRIFATDVMLESLGAGLSILTLLLFAQARRPETSPRWWRAFAICLTLLFFEKYNYWLIVAAALAGSVLWENRGLVPRLSAIDWSRATREFRHPLSIAGLSFAVLAAAIFLAKPAPLWIAGQKISLFPPNNLVTIAYACFFLRAAGIIFAHHWSPRSLAAREIGKFHVIPVAISFLFPQRLGAFLGFLSPSNAGDSQIHPFPGNILFYARHFTADYHFAAWLGVASLFLAVLAWWRFRQDVAMRAVMLCFCLGAGLTVLHPNQKSRYLHSWLPALWVSAGAGAACLCAWLPRRTAPLGATVLAAGLVFAGGAAWPSRGHSPETGNRGEAQSLLDLSDGWLDHLPEDSRVAFLASQNCREWMVWTWLNRFPDSRQILRLPPSASASELARQLKANSCDWLVTVQVPPEAPAFTAAGDHAEQRRVLDAWEKNPGGWSVVWQGTSQGIVATVWRSAAATSR